MKLQTSAKKYVNNVLREISDDESDNSYFIAELRSAGAFPRFDPKSSILIKNRMVPKQEAFDARSKLTSEINSLKHEINSNYSDGNSNLVDNLVTSESEYEEPILDMFQKIQDIRQQKMSIMVRKENQKKLLNKKKNPTEELKDRVCNHDQKEGQQFNGHEVPGFQK